MSEIDGDRWESEEEFLEWIDEYCDYVIATGARNTVRNISNALRMKRIQKDLKADEISFEEAQEQYKQELVIRDDQDV